MTRFRRAEAGDVPQVHALLVENAVNDGGAIQGSEATLMQHGFGPVPQFRVVLAEAQDQTAGLVLFFAEYSSWRGRVGAFVQDLYVRPAFRGRGLGRQLLAQAMAHAADWPATFLSLMVQRKNAAAQGFYARVGFVLRADADMLVLEGAGLDRLGAP